jgi:hypothetical protein
MIVGRNNRDVTRDDILMLKKGNDVTNQRLQLLEEKVWVYGEREGGRGREGGREGGRDSMRAHLSEHEGIK